MLTEVHRLEVEFCMPRASKCFDHQIVPHAATVEISGRDEYRCRNTMTLKDRRCDREIVGVAIVERNCQRTRRKRSLLQRLDGICQRQHTKSRRNVFDEGVELLRERLSRKQGIALR